MRSVSPRTTRGAAPSRFRAKPSVSSRNAASSRPVTEMRSTSSTARYVWSASSNTNGAGPRFSTSSASAERGTDPDVVAQGAARRPPRRRHVGQAEGEIDDARRVDRGRLQAPGRQPRRPVERRGGVSGLPPEPREDEGDPAADGRPRRKAAGPAQEEDGSAVPRRVGRDVRPLEIDLGPGKRGRHLETRQAAAPGRELDAGGKRPAAGRQVRRRAYDGRRPAGEEARRPRGHSAGA